MAVGGELNLHDIPLGALRTPTRQIIINELNKTKVLLTEKGLPRDYRGFAHLTRLPVPSDNNPTSHLLSSWQRDPSSSLGQLEDFLQQLDRWDIADDIYELLREDAKDFSMQMEEKDSKKMGNIALDVGSRVLTYDDVELQKRGEELQRYDALLLYADQDHDFAQQMLDKLKNDFRLKLCMKDDLVGGLMFEHQALMELIKERCNRVIVIFSHSFINDKPFNLFIVSFTQALAIDQDRSIIIPCLYGMGQLNLPTEINYLVKLDYNYTNLRNYDFWGRLHSAVTYSSTNPPNRKAPTPAKIFEISDSSKEQPSPVLKAKKSADWNITKSPVVVKKKCKSNSINDLLSVMEDDSNSLLSLPMQQNSHSTVNLSEKKRKFKSASKLLQKFFRSMGNKETKKSKKIGVRL